MDLVWFIDHAETISEENMQRIKALGGGIAIQHRMAYQGETFIHRYGKKAALGCTAGKKNAGTRITGWIRNGRNKGSQL